MNPYLKKYQTAITSNDVVTIQEIVSELNSLTSSEKKMFIEFYSQIGNDLFNKSLNVTSYNYFLFISSANAIQSTKKGGKNTKIKEEEYKNDFEAVLLEFHRSTEGYLLHLKSHFFFQLDNDSNTPTKLLILTDSFYNSNPLLERIAENYKPGVQKYLLSDFINQIKSNLDITNQKYLCLISISPNLSVQEGNQDLLKDLFGFFKKTSEVKLKKTSDLSAKDYELHQIDEKTYDHIDNVCGKLFNNRDITFEEEVIIKKMFGKNTPIIDYKILKGGFSGSKVIEVQPLKNISSLTGRYVIKYSKIEKQRKVYKEYLAFKDFIDEFNIGTYRCDYAESSTYEAIKYNYASSDTRTESYPFALLIKEFVKGKRSLDDLKLVLKQLFACDPFKIWMAIYPKLTEIGNLYNNYIDESEILRAISEIDDMSIEDVTSSELWINFQKIKSHVIQTNTKVCHGDLHSENFFKDDSNVYLIDFGYTAFGHAIIDHATLEASIKFKHIPFFIPTSDLIEIENNLSCIDTFNELYDLSFINRKITREIFELILTIRKDAKKFLFDKQYPTEYLISLFMITIRQIQYTDLNQRYALHSAKELSKNILTMI